MSELKIDTYMKGELSKRFLTRIALRRIASLNWEGATHDHAVIAREILADEGKIHCLATDLFYEAQAKAQIEFTEGMSESKFLDTILKVFEWIKENPEFILLIIKLFGVV